LEKKAKLKSRKNNGMTIADSHTRLHSYDASTAYAVFQR